MDTKSALESATTIIRGKNTIPSMHNSEVGNMEFSTDMMQHFFSVESPDQTTSKKLNEVFEWAEGRKGEGENVLSILKDIRFRLGSPSIGDNPLNQMHRYMILRNQASSAEMSAKAMER